MISRQSQTVDARKNKEWNGNNESNIHIGWMMNAKSVKCEMLVKSLEEDLLAVPFAKQHEKCAQRIFQQSIFIYYSKQFVIAKHFVFDRLKYQ